MRRSPISIHPLALSDDDRSTPSPRASAELPRKELLDGADRPVELPAVQEIATYRTRMHSRGRWGTPTPTLMLAKTASEVVAKPPIGQTPIAEHHRGYITSNRRGTPIPAFTSRSASIPTSSTPTMLRSPSPHGHLKRSDSNFDLSERRDELNPYPRRRITEDDQLRATIAETEKENSTLSQQLYYTRSDLAEAIKKNGGFQHRIQSLLDEKSKVLSQQQAAQKEAAEKERAAAKKIAELEAAHRRKDDELCKAQALRAEEKQLSLSKLPVVRTADLNRTQTFLPTADTYSGPEIIAMVEALNGEIFQTAAYMAELIEDESMAASVQERNKNVERNRLTMEAQLRRDLGEDLWQYFQKKYTELRVEPLPLQLAFQCILSRWSAYKIRNFHGNFGEDLGKVYQMIRESETQAVAGRWRALTNAKLSAFKDIYPANVMIDILINMLFLCGWSASSEKSKKAVVLMQQMVFNIEKMGSQIKTATKEGITTADLDVFVVHSRDSLRDGMEDVYADGSSGDAMNSETDNKRVLCTVGMGLRRTIIKQTEGRTPEYKEEILLKPKVALASVLDSGREGAEHQGKN